jgi:hypothetical protein
MPFNAEDIIGFVLIYLYVNPVKILDMSNTVGLSEASRPGQFFPVFPVYLRKVRKVWTIVCSRAIAWAWHVRRLLVPRSNVFCWTRRVQRR